MRFALFLLAVLVLGACGGGESTLVFFNRPVDIRASSSDVFYAGRNARFVYVANEEGKSVTVLDQITESFVDTDHGDPLDQTPLTVGGRPSAVAIQEGSPPRIFVADAEGRKLLAYDVVPPADPNSSELLHTPVDLGGAPEGRTNKPLFKNADRRSTPVITDLTVDPAVAKNEQWELVFEGDSVGYRVTGSISGRQTANALEQTAYTTDDGAVSFTVRGGGDPTTEGDTFYFGTIVTRPLALTGRPIDLEISGTTLVIVTEDPANVILYDLSSLSVTFTILLDDLTGVEPVLGHAALDGDHIYVPNEASSNVFDVKFSDQTVNVISTGIANRGVGVDADNGILYLIPTGAREITPWDLAGASVLPSIRLFSFGLDFVAFADPTSGTRYGLIPSSSGEVEVVNLATRTRFDTDITSDVEQSHSGGIDFYDVGEHSEPNLVSVGTEDGVTRTETWQLIYEGVLPDMANLDATVSGDQFMVSGATFISSGISVGDRVVLNPDTEAEEASVSAVVSEEVLQLNSTPDVQGPVTAEIRVSGSYLVAGSSSGVQSNRLTEGVTYTSDTGAVSISIQPSLFAPTTRGDFFTFFTIEADNPIGPTSQRGGERIAIFTRTDQTEPLAYVAHRETNSISILDLRTFDVRRVVR